MFRFGAGAIVNRAAFNDYVGRFTVNQPADRMAANRRLDRRRVYRCAGEFRKWL
jgi:hypothetical protein